QRLDDRRLRRVSGSARCRDGTRLQACRSAARSAGLHEAKGDRKQQEADGAAPVADRLQQDDRVRKGDRGADPEREGGEADEYPAERSHARIICVARPSTREADCGLATGGWPYICRETCAMVLSTRRRKARMVVSRCGPGVSSSLQCDRPFDE